MAKARTSRPTPAATNGRTEVEFMTDRLIEKVWQGDEAKRGLAAQAASVALAAIQDYTASRYMETADEFTGRDLVQRWLDRHGLLEEARASVALDKGDGETQSVEGAFTRKPSELPNIEQHEARWHTTLDARPYSYYCDVQWSDGTTCDARSMQFGPAVHRRLVTTEPVDEAPKLAEVVARPHRFERVPEGYARTAHAPEVQTPDEWSRRLGVTIHDPDGWRQDGKSWDEPISRAEFMRRMQVSTIEKHPDPDLWITTAAVGEEKWLDD